MIRRFRITAAALLLIAGAAAAGGPVSSPVRVSGQWMVDDQGRVVTG
jgi:hypothetical protein